MWLFTRSDGGHYQVALWELFFRQESDYPDGAHTTVQPEQEMTFTGICESKKVLQHL